MQNMRNVRLFGHGSLEYRNALRSAVSHDRARSLTRESVVNLIKCQYHASSINLPLVWEMDVIHVNAESLPQISRLQPREQLVEDRVAGMNRFLTLLVSNHGSAQYHYDKYVDFYESVRRFFNA